MPSPSPLLPQQSKSNTKIKVINNNNNNIININNHHPFSAKLSSNFSAHSSRFPSSSFQNKLNNPPIHPIPKQASLNPGSSSLQNNLSNLRRPIKNSVRSNLHSPTITAKVRSNPCPAGPSEPLLAPNRPLHSAPVHVRTRSSVSTGPTQHHARLSPHIPPRTPHLRADTPSDLSSSLRLASDSLSSLSVSPPPPTPHPLPSPSTHHKHPPLAPALAIRRTSHSGPIPHHRQTEPADHLSPRSPTNSLAVDWPHRPGSTAPSSPPSLDDGCAAGHGDEPEVCAHDEARVHRKVLDLEISNASLLAINAALERTKLKQAAEIRALRARLAEPTSGAPCSEPCSSSSDGDPGDAGELAAEDAAFGEVMRLLEGLIGNASRALLQRPEHEGGKKVLSSVEVEEKRLECTNSKEEGMVTKHQRPTNLGYGSGLSSTDSGLTHQLLTTTTTGNGNLIGIANLNPRAGSRPASPSVKTLAGMFDLSNN